jgi:hypothetical protein
MLGAHSWEQPIYRKYVYSRMVSNDRRLCSNCPLRIDVPSHFSHQVDRFLSDGLARSANAPEQIAAPPPCER